MCLVNYSAVVQLVTQRTLTPSSQVQILPALPNFSRESDFILKRIKIKLQGSHDAVQFVEDLYASNYTDKLYLENKDGSCHVSAYSRLAAIYAATTFQEVYLINETKEGFFPPCIKERLIRK